MKMYNRKPQSMGDILGQKFSVENMGTGLKRGMVLKLTPAKIKEILGHKDFADSLKKIKLKGQDDNPILVIETRSGSPWRVQIHQIRYQLRQKINGRLKDEFIKDVRVY